MVFLADILETLQAFFYHRLTFPWAQCKHLKPKDRGIYLYCAIQLGWPRWENDGSMIQREWYGTSGVLGLDSETVGKSYLKIEEMFTVQQTNLAILLTCGDMMASIWVPLD